MSADAKSNGAVRIQNDFKLDRNFILYDIRAMTKFNRVDSHDAAKQ
jgi:hypothetical protein